MQHNCFIAFNESIDSYRLPQRFTFPFYYEPHPLCLIAIKQLQHYLLSQAEWQHNFGLEANSDDAIGKMFGVLLVQTCEGEVGFLAAYSGKLADSNQLSNFVPPVFDMLDIDGFFIKEQKHIQSLTEQIEALLASPELYRLQDELNKESASAEHAIQALRAEIVENRKNRKHQRQVAKNTLSESDFYSVNESLNKQSVQQKNELRDLNVYWQNKIKLVSERLYLLTEQIDTLKLQRKQRSTDLQQWLFTQYRFLNSHGDEKDLIDLFDGVTPPAGAGECAAPKLLNYAFKHKMKPLAMAEFWWGASPKSEIRQHNQFYAACLGKCQPILKHMLEGMTLDENPLLDNRAKDKNIDIVYQDDVMVVINKPAELLSVPGKTIEDSVYSRMRLLFPDATGPLIVHRLDMSTSGLMVISLNKDANKKLQKQFINRTVSKRYEALLNGIIEVNGGEIKLPLRVDLDDRPRQLVCYEYGKMAETKWHLIQRNEMTSRVYFYPKTGRTHQLRVHSAHYQGLNTPIVGDDLYGQKANRLHLHAESLTLNHPVTNEPMHFQVEADF